MTDSQSLYIQVTEHSMIKGQSSYTYEPKIKIDSHSLYAQAMTTVMKKTMKIKNLRYNVILTNQEITKSNKTSNK